MRKILIVEDNKVLSECTEIHLKRSNHDAQVVVAGSCGETRAALLGFVPDYAVVDQNLPDGEGLSLLPHLREANRGVQVVFTSGALTREFTETAERFGAAGVLQKPYDMIELDRALGGPSPKKGAVGALSQRPNILPSITLSKKEQYSHKVLNRLSSVMTGLRLLQLDMEEELQGSETTKERINNHIEKMISVIKETSVYVREFRGGDDD